MSMECRWCDEAHDGLYEPPLSRTAYTGRAFVHVPGCWPEMAGCSSWLEWDVHDRPAGLALYSATDWMIDYTLWEG